MKLKKMPNFLISLDEQFQNRSMLSAVVLLVPSMKIKIPKLGAGSP